MIVSSNIIIISLAIVLAVIISTISFYTFANYIKDINNTTLDDLREIEQNILGNLTDHRQVSNDTRDQILQALNITGVN